MIQRKTNRSLFTEEISLFTEVYLQKQNFFLSLQPKSEIAEQTP